MSWFESARKQPASAGSPAPRSTQPATAPTPAHASQGFQTFMQGLPASPAILDLGPALAANVRYFSERARYLRIADLTSTLVAAGEPGEGQTLDLAGALPFVDGESFDGVLAWDLLDYLRGDQIGMAMRRISPFLAPRALLFASVSFQKEIPAAPQSFRIQDEATLLYGANSGPTRPCPRHKLPDLERQLPGFVVEHSFLLRNGLQEYVFAHRP
jgi:hypothetical protein